MVKKTIIKNVSFQTKMPKPGHSQVVSRQHKWASWSMTNITVISEAEVSFISIYCPAPEDQTLLDSPHFVRQLLYLKLSSGTCTGYPKVILRGFHFNLDLDRETEHCLWPTLLSGESWRYPSLWREVQRELETENCFKLKQSRIRLDIRKKFFHMRVMRPWYG